MSDHPLDRFDVHGNGNCELHAMAARSGSARCRYGYEGKNHLDSARDDSNPYFTFDPSRCIVCSRCVRACEEVQGTFALTIDGRGFNSVISPGQHQQFIDSECVSCGACVQACPTDALMEKSVLEKGTAERSRHHHLRLLRRRMLVQGRSEGRRSRAHGAQQGRDAQSWPFMRQRPLRVGLRDASRPRARRRWSASRSSDPWREVSWDEAIGYAARGLKRDPAKYGPGSIGGITSSRCTNEETYLVQKMVRAAFGNNNVDTCARVCHSPTGYGLKTALRHVGRHPGFRLRARMPT